MPDNDHVPRGVTGPWRRPARAALDGLPSAEVGEELRLALSKAIRDAAPPPSEGLARALRDTAVGQDPAIWADASSEYLAASGRTDLASAVVRRGNAMLELRRQELPGMRDEQVAQELTEGGLRRFADARLWGPREMLRSLVNATHATPVDARRYQESCLDHAQIPEIAGQMIRRPGQEIRAPRARTPRVTTREMLDEEVR